MNKNSVLEVSVLHGSLMHFFVYIEDAKYKLHGAVHYLYGKLLPGPYTDTTNASTWESFLFIMGKNGQRGVTVKFGNTNICLQVVVREGALLFRYKEDQVRVFKCRIIIY